MNKRIVRIATGIVLTVIGLWLGHEIGEPLAFVRDSIETLDPYILLRLRVIVRLATDTPTPFMLLDYIMPNIGTFD